MADRSSRVKESLDALATFRHLTDAEAIKLVDQGGLLDEPVEWIVTRTRNDRPVEVRTSVTVVNPSGERLFLRGRIIIERPWESHWLLTWGDSTHHERPVNLRRLDLRDDHANPDGAESWDRRTHKHLWSSQESNSFAYTPDDIPHDPAVPPVTPDDYRAIFEAFAGEVNIVLTAGYTWSDPPALEAFRPDMTVWEVP